VRRTGSTRWSATALRGWIRRSPLAVVTRRRREWASLARTVDDLRRANEGVVAEVSRLASDVDRWSNEVRRDADRLAEIAANAERDADRLTEVAADVQRQALTAAATRAGLLAARELLDKVAVRAPSRVSVERLSTLTTTNVAEPLLSIAIPSFNRPAALAECLHSIERELADVPAGLVEVCITDDVSTDPETLEIAADFAERSPFASLRQQPTNVGLERNILAACEPCRGEHVLILGNDDKFVVGALSTVIDDLRDVDPSVYLFERQRINADGSPHRPVAGTDPIDLPAGDAHLFATLLEATRRQGFLSTLGFTSHVIFRRQPFVAVDAARYLDLTLYGRVFVLIEAFASERLLFRNAPVVFHRTPTTSQKHAESVGRSEERFMAGGSSRASRYFGTTLAAALQRLVDRGAVDHRYLADLPETQMAPTLSLVTWIASNRAIDPGLDESLGKAIVADADRLFSALGDLAPID
jgi:hypothetical protein